MRDSKQLAAVVYYALLVLMLLAFLVDFYVVCSFMVLEVRISATSWLIHFVFTAVGYTANAFVLIGVVGSKKMRSSPVNMLLFNLAASDFTYIITNDRIGIHDWPPWMVNRLWGFASYMCPVNRYVSSAAFMASIGTFIAIAIERYVVTVRPLHARSLCSRSKLFYWVLAVWIFAFAFELPNYIAYDAFDAVEYYSEKFNATLHFATNNLTDADSYTHPERPLLCINPSTNATLWKIFKWAEFCVSYVLPIGVAAALYPRTCRAVWAVDPGSKGNSVKSTTGSKASSAESRSSDFTEQDRRQVVKMLIVCVVVFFVCYTPLVVIFVQSHLFPVARHRFETEFILVASELVKFVCAFNPFIYTLFSAAFRHRVKEILTCQQTIDVFLSLLFLVYFYCRVPYGLMVREVVRYRLYLLAVLNPSNLRQCTAVAVLTVYDFMLYRLGD